MSDTKDIYGVLTAVQSQLNVPKNNRNTFGNYNYRSAEDIMEAIKPVLLKNEVAIFLSDEIVQISDRIYVKATATFCLGNDKISATAHAREAATKKGMDDAQVTGAASSYARKYALSGLLCIDDNKDFDTGENEKERKKREEAPVKKTDTATDVENEDRARFLSAYNGLLEVKSLIDIQEWEVENELILERIKNPNPKNNRETKTNALYLTKIKEVC